MKNRYTTCTLQKNKSSPICYPTNNATLSTTTTDNYFIEPPFNMRKNSVIKLKMPNIEVKEIYDISYLDILNNKIKSPQPVHHYHQNSSLMSTSTTSSNSSGVSSILSISPPASLNTYFTNQYDLCSRKYSKTFSNNNNNNMNKNARASLTKSIGQNCSSDSISPMFDSNELSSGEEFENEERFTFRDFVSTMITSENKEMHKLIIHDISRLLELKFRDFKRLNQQKIYLTTLKNGKGDDDDELFTQIAEKVFQMAIEEPNGILGARLQLRLELISGKSFDISDLFAYDASTMATSELYITLKEQEHSKTKRFVNKFRVLSSLDKYFAMQIDSENFNITKKRMYY
jgi:hypothetical protein